MNASVSQSGSEAINQSITRSDSIGCLFVCFSALFCSVCSVSFCLVLFVRLIVCFFVSLFACLLACLFVGMHF